MNGDQTPLLKYHLIFFACYLGGAILAGFLDPGMGASTVIGIALTLGSAYLALRSFRGDHGRGLDTDERWRMLKVGTIGVTGLTFAGMLFIKAVLESQPLALALGVRLPMWMVVVVSVVTAAFTALQLWLIYYLLNERSADGTPAAASTPMPAAARRVAAKAPARRLRVLVIGDDAAAHAVAWKLGQSMQVQEVLIAPGNAGTAGEGKCRNVELPDYSVDALLELARREQVDLTVAGLGSALAGGLVDRFKALDMRVLGPRAAALELEDTGTARRLLSREGVATVGENEPGRLVDVLYMTDGSYAVELAAWEPAPAQGDTASQSPPPGLPADLRERIARQVIDPLVLALARDDLEWQGFLGLRLNLADDGSPRVVGLRTWPGAAEASLAMMRLQVDLAGMAEAALSGRLDQFGVRSNPHPCLAIGRIAEGEEIGRQIHGLDRRPPMEVKIFHAGTRQAQGGFEVARRDVLTVCALGTSLAECRLSADEVLGRISWADAPAPAWNGATG